MLLYSYSTRWVKMEDIEYKRNAGVVCRMSHDLPTVGKISLLVINGDKLYFKVKLFSMYIQHFRGYTLRSLDSEALISTDDLVHTPSTYVLQVQYHITNVSFCCII